MELLKKLSAQVEQELIEDLVPYWAKFTIDNINGGFVGRVNCNNKKVYEAEKGGILNARLLWAFSATYKKFDIPALKEAAHRSFKYFVQYFIDKEYGGFFWILDAKGNVVDDRKQIYAQAFGIYGLVEYYSVFKDREALRLAYNLFHLIEKHARDHENGGYFEAYNRCWELNGDVRLSEKDENEPKSMNTHLHILEAYTNLYRYAPNKELGSRLEELILIFCNHIIAKDEKSLVNFMGLDWVPKSDTISYGHDIEASWLLTEAAEVLGCKTIFSRVKHSAILLARSVLENGVDSDGGLLNEENFIEIIDSDKDWWPQAEAMVGFLNAYEISGDDRFITAAWNSWEFIKGFILDKDQGEWFEKVNREGIPYSLDKVRSWKGPYHNMRAILEVLVRIERINRIEHILVSKKTSYNNSLHEKY